MGTPIQLLATSFRLPGDERVAGLYIDSEGRLLISEVRLARNLGSTREVLGQLVHQRLRRCRSFGLKTSARRCPESLRRSAQPQSR